MQLFEIVKVFKDSRNQGINRVFGHVRRGHKRRAHAKGFHIRIRTAIHAAGDGGGAVERVVGDQFGNRIAGHIDQNAVTGGRGFLDRARGVANSIGHRVDLIVAQGGGLFRGLDFRGQGKIVFGPALGVQQNLHRATGARAGIADVDALALEIFERGDAGIGAGHNGEGLGVDRKDCAQTFKGAFAFEFGRAVKGVVLPVGLGNAELQLAFADGRDVIDRPAGGFDRTAHAVVFAAFVHQAADRAAGGVVNAGHATGADGDKFFGLSSRGCGQRQSQSGCAADR